MLFPWTPVMFLPRSEWQNNVGFLTWSRRLKKSVSFSDWQAGSLGGFGWAEQGCWGLRVEDLDSCTRGVMERLGLPAKKETGGGGVAPLKADVPQGYILMHDGRNKIKQNGIKPSSGDDWWAGGGCCSPLAMLNLMRALPSICLCFTIRNSHRCPERKRPVLRCSKEILAHRHIRFNSAGHKMGTWLPFEGNSLTLAGSLKEYKRNFFFFQALLLLFCGLFLKHSCCPTVLLFLFFFQKFLDTGVYFKLVLLHF